MVRVTGKFVVLVVCAVFLSGCGEDSSFKSRSVCITGYNQFERQIHEFWLDGESNSGCHGNPSRRELDQVYGGGSKFTCGCRVTPGKQVSLTWSLARSLKEFEAGVLRQEFSTQVTIPQPESSTSRYFRVYFMKDGTAKLQWVDNMGAPEVEPSPEDGIL